MLKRKKGQTVVEVLLIMPVFFLMLFLIMELGNIAFYSLISHHVAFELARVGALVAVPRQGGKTDKSLADRKMQGMLKLMMSGGTAGITAVSKIEGTSVDPDSTVPTEDLVVTVVYPVHLIFPGTSWIFADNPKRVGIRKIYATVRMPIDHPLTINVGAKDKYSGGTGK